MPHTITVKNLAQDVVTIQGVAIPLGGTFHFNHLPNNIQVIYHNHPGRRLRGNIQSDVIYKIMIFQDQRHLIFQEATGRHNVIYQF